MGLRRNFKDTKAIILTEIISPYRIPVFNAIAKSMGDEFGVIFLGETEKRRNWKIYKGNIRFSYEVLPGIVFQKKCAPPYFLNSAIFLRLIKYSPQVLIIGGYHHPSFFLALLYAKLFKRRIILWCESNKHERRDHAPLKTAYKRWFVSNCFGFIVPGQASLEYLLSLGARRDKIWKAPNAVDNEYFGGLAKEYRRNKEAFKRQKGYPQKIILYVGRLISKKGVLDLIKVFQLLSRGRHDLGLLLVGSGEQEQECKEFCASNNVQSVFFSGFIHQEELPLYYAAADVFVFPTHSDAWGLVLNEAMASGLPVISSDAAGAAYDLIISGKNGYIFKKGDIYGLRDCLRAVLDNEEKRIKMGQNSLDIIKNYSPFQCAQGFIQAIENMPKTGGCLC